MFWGIFNMDWLLNNIVAFTLIVVAVVLVAVAVILYFFVFRKRVQKKIEQAKLQKEQRAQSESHSKDLASSVFKQKEEEEAKRTHTKEELAEFDNKLKKLVNINKNQQVNAKNFSGQVKEKAEEPKEDNSGYDAMSQFKPKK